MLIWHALFNLHQDHHSTCTFRDIKMANLHPFRSVFVNITVNIDNLIPRLLFNSLKFSVRHAGQHTLQIISNTSPAHFISWPQNWHQQLSTLQLNEFLLNWSNSSNSSSIQATAVTLNILLWYKFKFIVSTYYYDTSFSSKSSAMGNHQSKKLILPSFSLQNATLITQLSHCALQHVAQMTVHASPWQGEFCAFGCIASRIYRVATLGPEQDANFGVEK